MTNKQIISKYIKQNQRVLDLGCATGDLLSFLKEDKHISGYGIELKKEHVVKCIEKGLSVFQGNLNEGLQEFSDQSFDVAVLSQTLQQVRDPLNLIHDMCRVAKIAIVSFPNFAHWTNRLSLFKGDIPKTKTLPFDWFDTPNIRVVSLKSFRRVCREQEFEIMAEETFVGQHMILKKLNCFPNLLSEKGLFVLKKK